MAVDVSGLDLFFELREARHHGSPIDPIRLTVLDPQPSVDMTAGATLRGDATIPTASHYAGIRSPANC
jgi:hypothetical protein